MYPRSRSRPMATKKKPARNRPPRRQRRLPESLRLRSVAASFTVNDLPKSIAWYRDVLGFTLGERWEAAGQLRGIQLKAGGCDIDRKSTRLKSSHGYISYSVFC